MTLTVHLPDLLAESLKAEALALGVSPDRYASGIVERALSTTANPSPSEQSVNVRRTEPFWERITDRMITLPAEVFERLPTDGAAQHDRYLYGAPKNRS